MTKKHSLSVLVLTYNEEVNLERCLASVRELASDLIVVDSYSTDRTIPIAEAFGARVVQHEFVNQAQQFNWALDNIELGSEWVLRLDADEYLTDALRQEIAEKLPAVPDDISGFEMKRRVYFLGRWIRHGGYYPIWILRLFRHGRARSDEREMDEHIAVSEGRVERLMHDFVDNNEKGLEAWIVKHNSYSTREARERLRRQTGKIDSAASGDQTVRDRALRRGLYLKLPLFLRALLYFSYRYILRLGFLDGREGLIFHVLQGFWYRFLVDAKIYESRIKKL